MRRSSTFKSTDDSAQSEIDLTPMLDVVFIMLIFFIVTASFIKETGVEVDKPQAASASKLEKQSILIALTEKGEVVHNKQSISIAGVQPLVKRMIQKEPVPVIIQCDRAAPAGLLVRVIDEAKLGGAPKVSLASIAARK